MFTHAEAYERFMGRWSERLAPALVRLAGVGEGDEVLDVGAGTGALTAAALQAATRGRVTGLERSPDYAAFAARRIDDERARFEVGDAQQLPFADASFDRALSLLVLNFVPDPDRAVAEMARVTRPGGAVAAAVWDYPERMEMLRVFWDEAIALDPGNARRDEGLMPLCRSGELGTLWRRHGLEDVREAALEAELGFRGFEDFWSPFLLGQGPAGACVAQLTEDRRDALAVGLRARLLTDGVDGAFTLRARAWAVTGRVPSPA